MSKAVTRNPKVWVFNGGNTFTGNPKWLFVYVVNHRPDIEAWWICDDQATVARVRELGMNAARFGTKRANAVQRRTGVYVVNQVKEHIARNLVGAHLLNLWHGVGVKNIERGITQGYLSQTIAAKYIKYNPVYHSSQQFLVTSPAMEKHFRREVGLEDHNVVRGPYPQNVVPGPENPLASFDHDIRARAGAPADATIAVYAPTPRRTGTHTFLSRALPDVPALLQELEASNTLLVLKMHPHMTNDPAFQALRATYGDSPYLYFWDNSDDIYEVFGQVDVAVVDYSSILYDMLAAGVTRVIRYAFDLDDGENDVLQEGMDYLELSAGTLARDFDGLKSAFSQRNEVAAADLARLHEYFWAYSDTHSVEGIIESALEFTPVPTELPTLYTYDVFDTVIGRDVTEPAGVFASLRDRAWERRLEVPRHFLERFVEIRRSCESVCREERRKRPENAEEKLFEINLADIYTKMQEVYGLTDEARDALMQWEQELEVQHSRRLDETCTEVVELLDAGEDVRFVSDMYLPEETVRQMLIKAEPRFATVPLYLSSTLGIQKSTKALYLHVYRDSRYDYEKWIHTGDNVHADVKMPRQLGITTRRLPQQRFDDYERSMVNELSGADGYRLASILFRRRREQENLYEEMFAFRHVALWLVPYVDWVLEDALRRGYRTVYFISRDGHHMKAIADTLIQERGLDLKTAYIYGSRLSWRYAALTDVVPDEVFGVFGSFAGAKSLPALAKAARTSVEHLIAMVPALAGFGIEHLRPESQRAAVQLMGQSAALRAHILEVGRSDRELLQEYMREHVDFTEPHAFVEYWGRGYTQDCLVAALRDMIGDETDVPFYYARSIYSSEGRSVRHNFTTSGYSMLGVEAVFANLPHGTVERFDRDASGQVVPVVQPRDYDPAIYDAVASQLPDFARLFARTQFDDLGAIRRGAFRFGLSHFTRHSGNRVYSHHIGRLHDAVELGGTERPFAPPLTWKHFAQMAVGTPRKDITRNLAMSLAVSDPLQRRAFTLVRKYKLGQKAKRARGMVLKAKSRVGRALGRG